MAALLINLFLRCLAVSISYPNPGKNGRKKNVRRKKWLKEKKTDGKKWPKNKKAPSLYPLLFCVLNTMSNMLWKQRASWNCISSFSNRMIPIKLVRRLNPINVKKIPDNNVSNHRKTTLHVIIFFHFLLRLFSHRPFFPLTFFPSAIFSLAFSQPFFHGLFPHDHFFRDSLVCEVIGWDQSIKI